jgi:hypothetical protein
MDKRELSSPVSYMNLDDVQLEDASHTLCSGCQGLLAAVGSYGVEQGQKEQVFKLNDFITKTARLGCRLCRYFVQTMEKHNRYPTSAQSGSSAQRILIECRQSVSEPGFANMSIDMHLHSDLTALRGFNGTESDIRAHSWAWTKSLTAFPEQGATVSYMSWRLI